MDSLLESFAGKCFISRKSHELCVDYYSKRNKAINITNITVVSFIAVSNNITTSTGTKEPNSIIGLIYSIGLYFSVFISSLQQFLQYEKLTEKHRVAAVRYNNLYNAIMMYIVAESSDVNQTKQEFIKWVTQEYDNLYNSTPNVPKNVSCKCENLDTSFIFNNTKAKRKEFNESIAKSPVSVQVNGRDHDQAMFYQLQRMVCSYSEVE